MLMPQADRKRIFEHLFEDGVCIAKKDYNLKSHPEIKGVKNLYVIKALKSLASRGFVKEQFAWRHYYFYLVPEGVAYLREYLGLPEDVVPATHRQPPRAEPPRPAFAEKGTRGFGKQDMDRGAYRGGYTRGDGEGKGAGGGGYQPQQQQAAAPPAPEAQTADESGW